MKVKDAVSSIQKKHPEGTLIPLYTPWGEEILKNNTEDVWQEYPRPQLRRKNYRILNGKWNYAITTSDVTLLPGKPIPSDGQILVPFSPECLLSGVNRQLQPDEHLWYERNIAFSEEDLTHKEKGMRCILRFEAVDQRTVVYANGREIASHTGGYLPFEADITEFVGDNPLLLQVRVRDESDTSWYTRGKQTLNRGGMFYTAQSGIWQSVWYEWVPENYIQGLKITPYPDTASVSITLDSPQEFSSVSCTVYKADDSFTTDLLPGKRLFHKKTAP